MYWVYRTLHRCYQAYPTAFIVYLHLKSHLSDLPHRGPRKFCKSLSAAVSLQVKLEWPTSHSSRRTVNKIYRPDNAALATVIHMPFEAPLLCVTFGHFVFYLGSPRSTYFRGKSDCSRDQALYTWPRRKIYLIAMKMCNRRKYYRRTRLGCTRTPHTLYTRRAIDWERKQIQWITRISL